MFDARFTKGFMVGDRYQFKLIANLNNVFNHPVYFAANSTANDPLTTTTITTTLTGATPTLLNNFAASTFGRLNGNSANLSRIIRIGAEFDF
jgi:hypothetical protein